MPISMDQHRVAHDMFAVDEEDPHEHLDRCIDDSREDELFSVSKLIRGHSFQETKCQKTSHLRPSAIVRFNA